MKMELWLFYTHELVLGKHGLCDERKYLAIADTDITW
jgi:hypothetical protein